MLLLWQVFLIFNLNVLNCEANFEDVELSLQFVH